GTPGQPGIGADLFSVRWTGMVQPRYSGTYTFYTMSDDGASLWVSNNVTPLIDNWTDHAPTENIGNIDLVAGQYYNIRMEYYENGGGALAKLSWSAAFVAKDIIPQSQLYPFYLPTITSQPVAKAAAVGTSATFTVGATGSAPLSYQWRFNGAPVTNTVAT